jgi:beta-glucanase (GH16 family)
VHGRTDYTPDNVRVQDGELVITARSDPKANTFTSAKLFSRRTFQRESGYIEGIFYHIPQAKGVWPAFWAMPTNGTDTLHGGKIWPDGGEIDLIESLGDERVAKFCAHWCLVFTVALFSQSR